MQPPQVLIVGSGPSGLILALTLLKNGVPVRIIEKDPQHHVGNRGPGVQPRTLEVEYFLGVLDDIHKIAIDTPTIQIFDRADPYKVIKSSRIIQQVSPTPAFPITKPVTLGQARHQAVLRKHIEALGGEIELGTTFLHLEQDESGVSVELAKTSGGTEVKEKARYAYVVGTDGARSSVRHALGINFAGETREDEKMYIADVTAEGLEDKEYTYLWGEQAKAMVALRWTGLPKSFQMIFAGVNVDFEALKTNKNLESLQNELNRISGRGDVKLTNVSWQAEWRPNIRMAEHFHDGRVFLAGDAAHAHSPSGGQGLNSSIMDAYNIAWKIALVVKGQAKPALLDSYEVERIPVIAEMLQVSTELHEKSFSPITQEALGRAKVTAAEILASRKEEESPWRIGWKLFQLDVNYRWSNVVLDERYEDKSEKTVVAHAYGSEGHDIRAGDRAPDAPGLLGVAGKGGPDRLFEVFSPTTHTVLIFSSAGSADATRALTQPVLSILENLAPGLVRTALIVPGGTSDEHIPFPDVDYVFKDTGGHALKNYGLSSDASAIVVVRPDGVVGAFVSSGAGVARYLSLVFNSGTYTA